MFTEQGLKEAKKDLCNIISNFAMKDYKQANCNRNGKRKSYKHIPYSLGYETNEAMEIYHLVYGKKPEDITPEQEEVIKGYLLPIRTRRRELLEPV